MKLGIFFFAACLTIFYLIAPVQAENTLSLENTGSASQQKPQPLKTYVLTVLPEGSRQKIKLQPPATKLVVNAQSGDTAVLCGDGRQKYTCKSGNPLQIDSEEPIKQFWAENTSQQQVQLRINIYEVSDSQPLAQEIEEAEKDKTKDKPNN
ncbi:MAG: hypothetical protein WA919_27705 [Coleofasciculaceae cyanobacterium]